MNAVQVLKIENQLCLCRCLCIRSVCDGHLRQRWSAHYRKSGSSFPVCLPAQLHCPWLPGCSTVCQPNRCLHWWPRWHHEGQKDVPFQRGSAEPLHCSLPGCESLTNTMLNCLFRNTNRKLLSFFRCTSCPVLVPEQGAWLGLSSASYWCHWPCLQALTEWQSIETTGLMSSLGRPSEELLLSFWSERSDWLYWDREAKWTCYEGDRKE